MKNDIKKYFILKKYSNLVLCKDGEEEVKLPRNLFLVYDDVEEGDVWELKYNNKKKYYDYFSHFFDAKYYRKRFSEGIAYKGKIFDIKRDFYLVRVDKDKYGRIFKTETIPNVNIGDEIEFMVTYKKNGK